MRTKKEPIQADVVEIQQKKEVTIEKPDTLWLKLWKAKQEIGKVTKGNDNPYFKSKYADLNTLIEATEPILLKYHLILLQPISDGCVCTRIIDIESGDYVESRLTLPVVTDPQKQIAGVTYFRRATLQSLLSLQAVDDDGNEISKSIKNNKQIISSERFENALKAIKEGKAKKEDLFKFELSESQKITLEFL